MAQSLSQSDLESIESTINEGQFPQWAYSDEDFHKEEMEKLFGGFWHYIGHESEIPESGDYVVRYIYEDPFIFTRDEEEGLKVFFNSCRHRGVTLSRTDSGNTSHFRCPYHGWTYSNDGSLVGVPMKDQLFKDMDRCDKALIEPPRIESYKGFVFASMDEDVHDLDDYMGDDFKEYIDLFFSTTKEGIEVIGSPWRWQGEYNWKSGVENTAGDAYHGMIAHASALEAGSLSGFDPNTEKKYRVILETDGATSAISLRGIPEGDESYLNFPPEVMDNLDPDLTDDQVTSLKETSFFNFMLFPNLTFLISDSFRSGNDQAYPHPFIRLHRPISRNETEIWQWVVAPKEAPDEYKEKLYQTCQSTFSPTGTIEQDDIATWERVTEPANGMFSKKHDVKLSAEGGMEKFGSEPDVAEDWTGPGVATDDQRTEAGIRRFHKMWFNAISDSEERPWDVGRR